MHNNRNISTDPDQQRQILQSYFDTLTKESHNLRNHPDLLWQQIFNRMQWEDGPVKDLLGSALAAHTAPGAKPWFKSRMPYPESDRVERTLVGHTDLISSCRFSPDGRWIISASKDGTLKIWDAISGREMRTLAGHEGGVTRFAISRDSKILVSGSWDNTVKIWNPASGKCLRTLEGHENTISDVQITPEGRFITSAGQDSGVWLWQANTGELLEKIGLKETSPYSPFRSRISPGGVLLAFAAGGSLYLYDLQHRQMALELSIGIAQASGPFEFSPDGRYIACANNDLTVSIWDLRTVSEAGRITSHRSDALPRAGIGYATYVTELRIVEMAFSPDSNLLITGTNIGGLATWNVPERRGGFRMPKHNREISKIAFSPDGKFVVTGSEDATLKVLNPRTGMEIETFHGHANEISYCAVSPDGEKILSGSYDGTLRLWDKPEKKVKGGTFKHKHQVSACAINAEHNIALSGGQDGVVSTWGLTDEYKQHAGEEHKGPVEACAISKDGRTLLSYGDDVTLRQWDRQFGAQREAFKEANLSALPNGSMGSGFAKSCLVTADGKYAVTETRSKLSVWDLHQHEMLQFIEHHCSMLPRQSCVISPDDSYFVAVNDGKIGFYKFGESDPFRTIQGLAPMAFSPDGQSLLYREPDTNTLRIDDLSVGSGSSRWLESEHSFDCCEFSHQGDLVAACNHDGLLTVWDIETQEKRFEVHAHQRYAQDPTTFADIRISWNPAMSCAFTPDDHLVLTIGIDPLLKAWDVQTGERVTAFPMLSKGAALDVDAAQPVAILGDYGGSVFLVDIIQPES
ncbi:WD40 repeat domain-containing protein [bacterium]|nr:WD40 repeat domain-containing protein [bacterium]